MHQYGGFNEGTGVVQGHPQRTILNSLNEKSIPQEASEKR